MLKTPSQSSVSTTRVENERKSRQKTRTLFAAHLSQSDERSPRFTNVLGTFVDMQNHTQNSSTLHTGSKNSWKQLRAQSKHLRVFSDTSYTNYKHMETLKGIFQCPQKLTNVIQTSQNSPWLSLRSLNKWYGVFAPQYYKFSQARWVSTLQRLARQAPKASLVH